MGVFDFCDGGRISTFYACTTIRNYWNGSIRIYRSAVNRFNHGIGRSLPALQKATVNSELAMIENTTNVKSLHEQALIPIDLYSLKEKNTVIS